MYSIVQLCNIFIIHTTVCDWLMCARDHASTNYLCENSGNHGG